MYQTGEQVLYGIHGVCTIMETEIRTVDRKKVEYYVLVPNDQPGARYYVPTQNQAAVSKMRPLISKQELNELLQSEMDADSAWIEDENRRKQRYRELIAAGDRRELLQMIQALRVKKQSLQDSGRKFHQCDENFLRDAQKLLDSEFAHVLHIPQEEVGDYVRSLLLTK